MATQNFLKSLDIILTHEGGYVDHPKDPGGATNMGITRKTYSEWKGRKVTKTEIKNLSKADVAPIFKKRYWDETKCYALPGGLDLMVFDTAVNMGNKRAVKIVQRIVGSKDDGILGAKTLSKIFSFIDDNNVESLLNKYHKERQNYYESLSLFDTFGRGWTRRNIETLDAAKELS